MRKVLTAGGIVYHGGKILLIRHKAGGLALPKGHLESIEQPENAALREVAEETGYMCSIVSELGRVQRKSVEKTGEIVNKTIIIYKMSKESKLKNKPEEVPVWITPEEALSKMQHIEESTFLQQNIHELKSF